MTVGLRTKQAGNADLDQVFDPYVSGNSPTATGLNVGGTNTDINTRYAPISFGTAALATGFNIGGTNTDINTLFAAYGTASYSLPINGNTYKTGYTVPTSQTGYSQIGFQITGGNTYAVTTASPSGTSTLVSGSVPAGAVNVQITYGSPSIPSGDVDSGGGVTNPASSQVAVSSNPSTYYQTSSYGSSSGSRGRNYPVTITFYNAAGNAMSTTNINLQAEVEGSS
jgi:hypothetical protein